MAQRVAQGALCARFLHRLPCTHQKRLAPRPVSGTPFRAAASRREGGCEQATRPQSARLWPRASAGDERRGKRLQRYGQVCDKKLDANYSITIRVGAEEQYDPYGCRCAPENTVPKMMER